MSYHVRYQFLIGKTHFVGADVDVWTRKEGADFVKNLFQGGLAFRRLHAETHRPLKRGTMAGQVDFRNQSHLAFAAVGIQFPRFGLRVAAARLPDRMLRRGQLRKGLDFEPPSLILRQMPVKDVDFEFRQVVDFPLKFIQRDEPTPDILHEATDPERWPVGNRAARQIPVFIGQLRECLTSIPDAVFRNSLDADGAAGHPQPIGLLYIPFHAGNRLHIADLDPG